MCQHLNVEYPTSTRAVPKLEYGVSINAIDLFFDNKFK